MKYSVKATTSFQKDLKRIEKRGYDIQLLEAAVETLASGALLPERYRDHALTGTYAGFRECHIQPDWLLIYRIESETLDFHRRLREGYLAIAREEPGRFAVVDTLARDADAPAEEVWRIVRTRFGLAG